MKDYLTISGLKLIALIFWMAPAKAQPKYEREYVIKGDQIHPNALNFINESFKNVKAQWYREESLTGTTIEAKLRFSGKQYSIEFSDSGEVHDIEILTSFKALPENTRNRMTKQFRETFKNFKIIKTQIQWSGDRDLLKAALSSEQLPPGLLLQYELIMRAKKAGLSKYYEVLCDKSGNVKTIREIIQRNADNMIY